MASFDKTAKAQGATEVQGIVIQSASHSDHPKDAAFAICDALKPRLSSACRSDPLRPVRAEQAVAQSRFY
jgi:hypothetical protein